VGGGGTGGGGWPGGTLGRVLEVGPARAEHLLQAGHHRGLVIDRNGVQQPDDEADHGRVVLQNQRVCLDPGVGLA
jgi:hypothetical protein